ncbi:hypothetical protein, partial [Sideroxydans sp. CL21]
EIQRLRYRSFPARCNRSGSCRADTLRHDRSVGLDRCCSLADRHLQVLPGLCHFRFANLPAGKKI